MEAPNSDADGAGNCPGGGAGRSNGSRMHPSRLRSGKRFDGLQMELESSGCPRCMVTSTLIQS